MAQSDTKKTYRKQSEHLFPIRLSLSYRQNIEQLEPLQKYSLGTISYKNTGRLKGAHLMPPGERFITWDLPVEILLGVA